ncbi:hypothetical protein O5559_28045, partial [Escherichia coli]|nr:hypothetical protein [Escherichia coli]
NECAFFALLQLGKQRFVETIKCALSSIVSYSYQVGKVIVIADGLHVDYANIRNAINGGLTELQTTQQGATHGNARRAPLF